MRHSLGNYSDADLLLRCSRAPWRKRFHNRNSSQHVWTQRSPLTQRRKSTPNTEQPLLMTLCSVFETDFLWGMGFLCNVSYLPNVPVSRPSRTAAHCRIDQCWAVILSSQNEDNSPVCVMMSHTKLAASTDPILLISLQY